MSIDREKLYILRRKIKAKINSLCFYICRLFPIDKKLVAVCSFEGKGGFGCNPKYVVQELHRKNPQCMFVWFVNRDIYEQKQFPDYIKKVSNTLWSRAYWLSRSVVWIDNYRKPYGTVKRKGQYYLNTNHYTQGIKCVGLWREEGFSEMAYLVSKNDSDMIDALVIDSKFGEEMSPKGLVYEGNYLKTGSPRCDVLYGDRTEKKEAFRKKHNLPSDAKVLLFAPTFRERADNGKRSVFSGGWTIDFERVIAAFSEKFGGKWYICVRVHPQLARSFEGYRNNKLENRIINESEADDMYEILAGMDAYISDYSSACFEAGMAGIPVFLYADDIEKYKVDRGALFWDFHSSAEGDIPLRSEFLQGRNVTFPYTVAKDNSELVNNIQLFDYNKYMKKVDEFHSKIELCFDGKACERLSQVLIDRMK